jgi:hypothetical protein
MGVLPPHPTANASPGGRANSYDCPGQAIQIHEFCGQLEYRWGFMALWHWQKKLLYLVVDIEIHTTGSSNSLDDFLSMQLE